MGNFVKVKVQLQAHHKSTFDPIYLLGSESLNSRTQDEGGPREVRPPSEDNSLRPTVPKSEPDEELLPELSGLLPLHQHPRRGLRTLPVLQKELQDYLPQRLGREVGWTEGSRYVPR